MFLYAEEIKAGVASDRIIVGGFSQGRSSHYHLLSITFVFYPCICSSVTFSNVLLLCIVGRVRLARSARRGHVGLYGAAVQLAARGGYVPLRVSQSVSPPVSRLLERARERRGGGGWPS